jgi:hypothetical protein
MEVDGYIGSFKNILAKLYNVENREVVAMTILQEISKDRRMEEIKAERNNNNEPATSKQLGYLKKLGVEPEPGITKQEASKLIDEAVASR